MDNQANIDPWAKLGNMGTGNKSNEVSEEGLKREAEWNEVMEDVPPFGGETPIHTHMETFPEIASPESNQTPSEEGEIRDENISDASAIINFGLNAAAKQIGVEKVIEVIDGFVPNGRDDPIKQLFIELGVDTKTERDDVFYEARAAKPREEAFRSEDINAPITRNRALEAKFNAIQEVKQLVAEVKSSPAYSQLRSEAMTAGKGVFEYAVSKYDVRDLTVLFRALSEQKKAAESKGTNPEEEPKPEELTEEEKELLNQIESHLSTENSSPETDAAASNGSLL